jgi:hypothetical protein
MRTWIIGQLILWPSCIALGALIIFGVKLYNMLPSWVGPSVFLFAVAIFATSFPAMSIGKSVREKWGS